jgi:hypothetical protein
MPAVLRAYGRTFNPDAFLATSTLPVCTVKRLGEPRAPGSEAKGHHDQSGIHIAVSDADFSEFPAQLDDAITFLSANEPELRRLYAFPGVESLSLDFGIARREVAVQCDRLPPTLVALAGSLGLAIELSQYPLTVPR